MFRMTKKVLEERVSQLSELTNRMFVVGYWNGMSHVYDKSTGENLSTGTLRECKNAVDMFMYGYKQAIDDSFEIDGKEG